MKKKYQLKSRLLYVFRMTFQRFIWVVVPKFRLFETSFSPIQQHAIAYFKIIFPTKMQRKTVEAPGSSGSAAAVC